MAANELPTEKIDAVIVGAGASGIAIAAKLAKAGKQVAILEAGPARDSSRLVSSTLFARRLKWSGDPVIEEGQNPIGHAFNASNGVGGAALHHYGVWPRFHEEDFDMRSRYDRGLDWPISYDDLAPYYDDVQAEAGIAGDAEQEHWRPAGAPYPLPPVPLYEQGAAIARGFAALDMDVAPLPLAVTTETYRGRPPCLYDGWCDAGCPIGALANPLTIHLPVALTNGAQLVTDTAVTKVLTDDSGETAVGVEVRTADGEVRSVMADIVVLAAFAVQNPRLMLASANEKHPNGLGNTHDLVGRYITTHAAGLIYGLFEEQTQPYKGAFGGQLVNQDSYPKLTHADSGAFGSYQWMIAQAVKPNDLLGIATTRPDLFGSALHDFMTRATQHFAGMTAVVEDIPVAENRITLSSETDAHGVPLALATHSTHEDSNALWRACLEEGKRVFNAAGATDVWTGPQGTMHIMGGTIMGTDPANSVTNSYGQVHSIPNLIIGGPGLFPTSAGVNPTYTMHALAARTAEHVLEHWGSITA